MKNVKRKIPHPKVPWILGIVLLLAQAAIGMERQQGETATRAEWTDTKLRAVASAYLKVAEIQQAYDARISGAETQQRATALQREANQQIVETIEEEDGVTVNEYSEVVGAAQNDDDVRERLIAQIEQLRKEEEANEGS